MSIKDTILDRLQTAKDNQQAKFDEFNECDDLFNSKVKTQPGNSQVFNPRAWSAVEMLVPRMVAKKPTVEYLPREMTDQDKSDLLSELFSYWWDKVNGFTKLVELVKTATIYGTSIAKVCWQTKSRNVKKYALDEMGQPLIGEDGNYLVEDNKVTYFDDPDLEVVNNYHLYFNPGATDPDNAQWIIHEYWKPLADLEREQAETGIYKDLSKLKKLIAESDQDKGTHEDYRHESTGNDKEVSDTSVDKIRMLEMWDLLDNKQYILAADSVCILDRENPYWHGRSPFIRIVDSLVPFEWFGKGEVHPIKGLQHALNTIRNQRIDNVTQAVAAMWKVKGEVDETELEWQPNGVIHVSDFDDAQLVEYPEVTQNAYQEETFITAEMDHALGSADYTQIGDSGSDRTATGMSIKAEQINSRFFHKIQLLEEMGLKKIGDLVLALYQQYITSERVIRITGDNGAKWTQVTPQDVAGEYDCVVEAGSTQPVNKDKDKEESVNLLGIFGQDPDLKPEGRYELKTKTVEKFGYKKAAEMFYSPQEQQQMEQQAMIQQQAEQEQQMMMSQQNQEMQVQAEDTNFQRDMAKMQMKGQMDMEREAMRQPVM